MAQKKKHILIAEDDALLADLLRQTCSENGARVSVARDGLAAKKKLAEDDVDILLLDLLMPDVDGFAVLEHVRDSHANVPVIVLSNLSDNKSRERCRELGCCSFLVKSEMDDRDIWPVIKRCLR